MGGVDTVQTLMTGTHPWQTAQLTHWLFARLCWRTDADVDALVDDFCHAAFGDADPTMGGYYQALEDAFTLVLDQTPDQRGHFSFPSLPLDLIRRPATDMEDPIHALLETLLRRAGDAPTIPALVEEAAGQLKAAREATLSPQLDAEASAFELLCAWLRLSSCRLQLYAATASIPPDAGTYACWMNAQQAYEQVLDWGDVV
jgi:hypothetical protein